MSAADRIRDENNNDEYVPELDEAGISASDGASCTIHIMVGSGRQGKGHGLDRYSSPAFGGLWDTAAFV